MNTYLKFDGRRHELASLMVTDMFQMSYHSHFPSKCDLLKQTCHRIYTSMINTTRATSRAGSTNPSVASDITPKFLHYSFCSVLSFLFCVSYLLVVFVRFFAIALSVNFLLTSLTLWYLSPLFFKV